jgi:hypothetical protein
MVSFKGDGILEYCMVRAKLLPKAEVSECAILFPEHSAEGESKRTSPFVICCRMLSVHYTVRVSPLPRCRRAKGRDSEIESINSTVVSGYRTEDICVSMQCFCCRLSSFQVCLIFDFVFRLNPERVNREWELLYCQRKG